MVVHHTDSGDMKIQSTEAVEAIRKKLLGKPLHYKEIFSLMDEVAHERLGSILTTYFVAAGFKEGFSNEELYFLTKAMVETGSTLKFQGIIADKHSVGGLAGTRTSMILVPLIAAAGFKIPKNSSRAITTPAGTADTMEVLAPVTFTPTAIEKMVEKVGGCIVWGGHLGIAPADDVIIKVETPLAFESFDKIIVSIMAKKVASGATHLVLDIPLGQTMKIRHIKDAQLIADKFQYLAGKFHIQMNCDINFSHEPAGQSVGPSLEAQDVLRVLKQTVDRPIVLEEKTIRLAGKLLDLCFKQTHSKEKGETVARMLLKNGSAYKKMMEIIKIQGGNSDVEIDDIPLGKYSMEIQSKQKGKVSGFNNLELTTIAKILGCPQEKESGIFLHKRLHEKVDINDILCRFYTTSKWKLDEAIETLKNVPIYTIE